MYFGCILDCNFLRVFAVFLQNTSEIHMKYTWNTSKYDIRKSDAMSLKVAGFEAPVWKTWEYTVAACKEMNIWNTSEYIQNTPKYTLHMYSGLREKNSEIEY